MKFLYNSIFGKVDQKRIKKGDIVDQVSESPPAPPPQKNIFLERVEPQPQVRKSPPSWQA